MVWIQEEITPLRLPDDERVCAESVGSAMTMDLVTRDAMRGICGGSVAPITTEGYTTLIAPGVAGFAKEVGTIVAGALTYAAGQALVKNAPQIWEGVKYMAAEAGGAVQNWWDDVSGGARTIYGWF